MPTKIDASMLEGGAVPNAVNLTGSGTISDSTTHADVTGQKIGYRDVPQVIQSGNFTFAISHNGKHIYSLNSGAQTLTVPTNASVSLPIGFAVTVINNGSTDITITTTGTTTYKAGVTTAWASGGVLSPRGMATFMKVETNVWFVSGAGLV